MPIDRSRNRRPALIGTAPIAMIAAVLAAVAGSSASTADGGTPVVRAAQTYAWSPAQVRALIDAVAASRRHGLDPAAYGIAALRAELVLCEQLWNTPGSRQLDTLARTAALALANDYRRQQAANASPVAAAELDAALGAGRVGPWLAALAPAERSAS